MSMCMLLNTTQLRSAVLPTISYTGGKKKEAKSLPSGKIYLTNVAKYYPILCRGHFNISLEESVSTTLHNIKFTALIKTFMLVKSYGPSTHGWGFSTNLRSPNNIKSILWCIVMHYRPRVASSKLSPCRVSLVWFTTNTSNTMSYWLICT